MSYALIIIDGERIWQVAAETFAVAEPLAWIECADGVTPETHHYVGGSVEPIPAPEPQPPKPWEVRKLLIVDRLEAAGLFGAAMAALGGPGNLAYERWSAATAIASDDAQVRGLLTAIGADPDAILARE